MQNIFWHAQLIHKWRVKRLCGTLNVYVLNSRNLMIILKFKTLQEHFKSTLFVLKAYTAPFMKQTYYIESYAESIGLFIFLCFFAEDEDFSLLLNALDGNNLLSLCLWLNRRLSVYELYVVSCQNYQKFPSCSVAVIAMSFLALSFCV